MFEASFDISTPRSTTSPWADSPEELNACHGVQCFLGTNQTLEGLTGFEFAPSLFLTPCQSFVFRRDVQMMPSLLKTGQF